MCIIKENQNVFLLNYLRAYIPRYPISLILQVSLKKNKNKKEKIHASHIWGLREPQIL